MTLLLVLLLPGHQNGQVGVRTEFNQPQVKLPPANDSRSLSRLSPRRIQKKYRKNLVKVVFVIFRECLRLAEITQIVTHTDRVRVCACVYVCVCVLVEQKRRKKKKTNRKQNSPRFVSGDAAECGGQFEPHGHRSRQQCVVRVVATVKQCRRRRRRRPLVSGHRRGRRKCAGAGGCRFRSRRRAYRRIAGISLPHAGRYPHNFTQISHKTDSVPFVLCTPPCSSSLARKTDSPERSCLFVGGFSSLCSPKL